MNPSRRKRRRCIPPSKARAAVQGPDVPVEFNPDTDEDFFLAIRDHHHEVSGDRHLDLVDLLIDEER